jgi:hypothetical protein
MLARTLAALLATSLVIGCADPESETPHLEEEAEAIDDVLRFGGELVVDLDARSLDLPECGIGRLCAPGVELGCCESEEGPVCFSCERPVYERPESECERDADCGEDPARVLELPTPERPEPIVV